MYSRALFLFLSALAISNANVLPTSIDVKRLQTIFEENVRSKDINALYHSVKGLKQLNVKIPDVCETIKNYKYDLKNIEQIYYLTNAAALSDCLNSLTPDILSAPTQVLDKKDVTIQELYYAVFTLKALGKGSVYDKEDGLKNLVALLKKDDTPVNYGYVFSLCEHMGCGTWTTTHAEGVLLAADESDSKALHFEGGLPVTALLLTSITRTYKAQKKPSPLTETSRYKFAEYLLSRRSVNSPRGAFLLLDAATALADDQPSPISITIKGKKYITFDADTVEFSITDLIGRPVPSLKAEEVVAQSGTRLADDVVVLSKQPLNLKPNEPTTFVLNLSKIKAQYGLYKIALSAGSKSTSVNIAVLGEIQVTSIEVGIGDVDGTTSPKLTTVAFPNKLTDKLQADHLQKVTLKFTVRDKWNKPVLVQQAFVRVGNAANDDETIFVAEPDNAKAYKVDLNVGSIAKHLKSVSGSYTLTVFLGDSAVSNPISWSLGEVYFNFGSDSITAEQGGKTRTKAYRGALPEISHVFRSPEARPARLVSDVFAAAAAAPLLLLLLLWAALGINFGNYPYSFCALAFQLSLGSSLALYGLLWLELSMFDTVRYLVPLAGMTFLTGNRLLRCLVEAKAMR